MTSENVCAHCNKDLALVDEIHVVTGVNYCSKECAIKHITDDIILNAGTCAIEEYNDKAEIVNPIDIGICYERTWTAYNRENDVTTIFKSRYLDKEYHEVVCTELVGFYYGEPNEEDTKNYYGELKAIY